MAIPLVVMAIGAAVAAVATAVGAAIAQGNLDKAREIREKALAQYGDDIRPQLDESIAEEVGPSAFEAIVENPEGRDAQRNAMRRFAELYDSAGHTQGDEAALQLANQGAQQRASSDYQSLAQNLAARGQSMNPALAAAMASRSSGEVVNATATNRYRSQADARQRAMQALGESADIGGRMREQEYSRDANRAAAIDRVNQYNAGQRTNANNENNRRRLQGFDMDMALRGARTGAYNALAGGEENQARATQGTAAGIANAATSVAGGIAGGMGGGGGGGYGGFATNAARLPTPSYDSDEWVKYGGHR